MCSEGVKLVDSPPPQPQQDPKLLRSSEKRKNLSASVCRGGARAHDGRAAAPLRGAAAPRAGAAALVAQPPRDARAAGQRAALAAGVVIPSNCMWIA